MTAAFDRLAPFIQEFIWKRGWTDLREIQTAAIGAVLDTDDHLLLAAGTASGKTEAAFLPILSQLYDDPPNTVGAVYIGPLKALINDQFRRLGELCEEAHIPVTAWHGDVAASRKHSLLKKPAGVLQITPEALEGLLLNRSADLMRVFGNLRWVVIDEIHAFMASDRGGQVLSLLDRLSQYAMSKERLPRRAGLSATLGDYREAEAWLKGATSRGVQTITVPGGRSVYLLVDHFMVKPRPEDSGEESAKSKQKVEEETAVTEALIEQKDDLFAEAYSATIARKSLIFTNSRGDAEEMITALRHLAERKHTPDIYHVHHGSIAAPLREAAEDAMRDPEHPACTAATITLELGIDLGQLDRVLQLESPSSVASFLQRLGRAGRRGQRPEMLFLIPEDEHQEDDAVVERLPWDLLQAIAIIQLYAEEKWIEPIYRPQQRVVAVIRAARPIEAGEFLATLDELTWPAHFLDFESVSPALSWFEGTGPYEAIPFQFSLHVRAAPGEPLKHYEFLAPIGGDWRSEISEALIARLGKAGSVVMYSTCEKRMLAVLADAFPNLRPQIEAIILRLFDLESVIKDGYWHPHFRGPTSIKYVLPAMVKNLAYDGLAIRGGDDAAGAFALMYVNQTPTEQHESARAALLAYCKLDTLAMVRVHEELLTIRARHP